MHIHPHFYVSTNQPEGLGGYNTISFIAMLEIASNVNLVRVFLKLLTGHVFLLRI